MPISSVANQINYNITNKIARQFCFAILRLQLTNIVTFSSENIIDSDRSIINANSVVKKLSDSRPHVKLLSHLIALSLIKTLSGEHQIELAQKVLSLMNLDELAGIDDLSQEHLTLNVSDLSLVEV